MWSLLRKTRAHRGRTRLGSVTWNSISRATADCRRQTPSFEFEWSTSPQGPVVGYIVALDVGRIGCRRNQQEKHWLPTRTPEILDIKWNDKLRVAAAITYRTLKSILRTRRNMQRTAAMTL
jgi:hypothetical protein